MLSSHLTSCLSVCSLVLLLSSCSGVKSVSKQKTQKNYSGSCSNSRHDLEVRHLTLSARIKSSGLTYCFSNFLKFEENKKQKISSCNQLAVKKTGNVTWVQVTGLDGKRIPKDFKMCLTQEYRKMDFSGLQLKEDLVIRFPLTFSSI